MSTKNCLLALVFLFSSFSLLAADEKRDLPPQPERTINRDFTDGFVPDVQQPLFSKTLPPVSYRDIFLKSFLNEPEEFDAEEEKRLQEKWEKQDEN